MAARYQLVLTDLPTPALAPVIGRMNLLRARAMSSARLVLRTGAARAIQPGEAAGVQEIATALRTNRIDKIPERAFLSGPTYVWPPDVGVRLADVPADGLIVPWSEVEQHKLVYYALLNAGFKGMTLIDGDLSVQSSGTQVIQTPTSPLPTAFAPSAPFLGGVPPPRRR